MKKLICSLIINLSFFPQAIWAAVLFHNLTRNDVFMSRYLIYDNHARVLLFSCAAIVIFALLCMMKRFYAMRLLLIAGYAVFAGTVLSLGVEGVYAACLGFAGFGICAAIANTVALYGYRSEINRENTGQEI
ncbi:MAG: hypothetical protein FWH20_08585 [Oscillospiraceae bacterium]|nr:hypothetical protein [Oscillospiraceae bacterium]